MKSEHVSSSSESSWRAPSAQGLCVPQENPWKIGTCALLCRESPVYVKLKHYAHSYAHEAFIAELATPSQVLWSLSDRLNLASTMATFCNRSTPRLYQEQSQKAEIQNLGGGAYPQTPPAGALCVLYYSAQCVHLSKATVDQLDHFKLHNHLIAVT